MPRVYVKKGPEAKTHRLTVPLTAKMFDSVEVKAREAGKDKASLVRELIECWLYQVEDEAGEKVVALARRSNCRALLGGAPLAIVKQYIENQKNV